MRAWPHTSRASVHTADRTWERSARACAVDQGLCECWKVASQQTPMCPCEAAWLRSISAVRGSNPYTARHHIHRRGSVEIVVVAVVVVEVSIQWNLMSASCLGEPKDRIQGGGPARGHAMTPPPVRRATSGGSDPPPPRGGSATPGGSDPPRRGGSATSGGSDPPLSSKTFIFFLQNRSCRCRFSLKIGSERRGVRRREFLPRKRRDSRRFLVRNR